MKIKLGPSAGNSGAIIRWGDCFENGVWFAWKHFRSLKMWKRFRIRRKDFTIGLLSGSR